MTDDDKSQEQDPGREDAAQPREQRADKREEAAAPRIQAEPDTEGEIRGS